MKSVRFVLFVLMLLFMGVQYNDPDGLFWVLVYGTVACSLAISVWRSNWLRIDWVKISMLGLTLSLGAALWLYWPPQARFWQQAVWWEEETAREGMGIMIALLFQLFVLPVAFVRRSSRSSDSTAEDSGP